MKSAHIGLRNRWILFALIVSVVTALFAGMGTGPAFAFQEAEKDEAAEPDDPDEETPSEPIAESFLTWMVQSSGVFGFVLLLLSFVMVALIMMNVMQVRRDIFLPPALIEELEDKIDAKDFQGAFETARKDDSFVARVLAAGLSKLNRGYSEAIEGMQEVGEDENMILEHRLSYLALIGSIAPMIGLMGTVYGMIQSFQHIAASTTSPKPSELAGGIATALFTTLEGLTVAIPALIFYSLLRNRVARFMLEVGMISENLLGQFPVSSKTKATASATRPAAPPAAPKNESKP